MTILSEQASMSTITEGQWEELEKLARVVAERAYAPYSRYCVGAAILTEAGNVYTGCNVENASLGLTSCAERSAISVAVSAEGPSMRLCAVQVVIAPDGPVVPCGGCRQMISQFGPADVPIRFQWAGSWRVSSLDELLPFRYTEDALPGHGSSPD